MNSIHHSTKINSGESYKIYNLDQESWSKITLLVDSNTASEMQSKVSILREHKWSPIDIDSNSTLCQLEGQQKTGLKSFLRTIYLVGSYAGLILIKIVYPPAFFLRVLILGIGVSAHLIIKKQNAAAERELVKKTKIELETNLSHYKDLETLLVKNKKAILGNIDMILFHAHPEMQDEYLKLRQTLEKTFEEIEKKAPQ